jgi:D-glycero-alpha-D-manno-heptose-7-phosphate kinase
MLANLHYVKENGFATKVALENGDMSEFAHLMHDHWENKRKRSADMSNPDIDRWYHKAMDHGAIGGKLVGAGSGGFLLFYAKDQDALRQAMRDEGLTEVRFQFDHDGSNVLVRD